MKNETETETEKYFTTEITLRETALRCAVPRTNADVDGDDVTLPNALDAFRPNHFVLLVDRCAESGANVELCGSDGIDDYDDSSKQTMNNQWHLRSFGAVISTS